MKKTPKKPIIYPVHSAKITARIQEEKKTVFSINLKLALLLGLISCMVYANTLRNGFVLDDSNLITENKIVNKGISAIPEILSTPYRRGFWITANDTYRPLSLVMFAMEYQFFGNDPAPGHFINILLYAGCVILLFLFLDLLFEQKKTKVAFIASLLFALHPIHTEVVANIKSRDELLCFFFSFLSLHLFIKYIKSGRISQLLVGSTCFLLSLLSKETAITFLAVIPLIFFFYRNENIKRSTYVFLCSALMAIIFLTIRLSVLNYYHANEIANISIIENALASKDISYESKIATAILILGYYLKLLFVPYPLICDYSYNTIPFTHFGDPLVLISVSVCVFIVFFSLKRLIKNHNDPFVFGILFFIITISLVANIVFLIGTTMGERLVFFPSVGFCLVLALMIEKFVGKQEDKGWALLTSPKLLIIIIPISLIYAFITFKRNNDWINNYTLFSTDIKKSPQSSHLLYLLGRECIVNIYNEEKDPTKKNKIINEGISYLKRATEIYPDFRDGQTELAKAYSLASNYDSAEAHGKIAYQLDPANILALNDLGGIYFIKKDYPKSIEFCKKAIKLQPDFVEPYVNVAVSYLSLGMSDSGLNYLYKAISVNPNYNRAYEILAIAYKTNGKLDSAKKYEAIVQKNNK